MEATDDFEPTKPGQLRLRKNDRIIVLAQNSGRWWMGILSGEVGRFPSSLVKKVKRAVGTNIITLLLTGASNYSVTTLLCGIRVTLLAARFRVMKVESCPPLYTIHSSGHPNPSGREFSAEAVSTSCQVDVVVRSELERSGLHTEVGHFTYS